MMKPAQTIRILILMIIFASCTPTHYSNIHLASVAGDLAAVRQFLDRDPRLLNEPDSAGWTPLHFAASQDHVELMEFLLIKGADLYSRLKLGGGTPLHIAASGGHKSAVMLLLNKGADANTTDDNGLTPLHRAAITGRQDIAELLLAAGANVNATSNTGVTAIAQATQMWHNDFVKYLRWRGGLDIFGTLPVVDDFRGGCDWWPKGETNEFSFGCYQGAYRFSLKIPGPVHITRNFAWDVEQLSVEVNATVNSGRGTESGFATLGIGCLITETHGYLGLLRTDGAWAIMRLKTDFIQLAGINEAKRNLKLQRTNHLRLVCSSDGEGIVIISFYVNGQEIGSVEDRQSDTSFHGVALYADTFPGEITFNNFVAQNP